MPKQIKGVAESNIEEELLCYLKCALISVTVSGAGKLQTNYQSVWSEWDIFCLLYKAHPAGLSSISSASSPL